MEKLDANGKPVGANKDLQKLWLDTTAKLALFRMVSKYQGGRQR